MLLHIYDVGPYLACTPWPEVYTNLRYDVLHLTSRDVEMTLHLQKNTPLAYQVKESKIGLCSAQHFMEMFSHHFTIPTSGNVNNLVQSLLYYNPFPTIKFLYPSLTMNIMHGEI